MFQSMLNNCINNTPFHYKQEVIDICQSTLPFIDKVCLIRDRYVDYFLMQVRPFKFHSIEHIDEYVESNLDSLNRALIAFEFHPTKEWYFYHCPDYVKPTIRLLFLVIKRLKLPFDKIIRYNIVQQLLWLY